MLSAIIEQYGPIILGIIVFAGLIAIAGYLLLGHGTDGSGSIVTNLFTDLLNKFAQKSNLSIDTAVDTTKAAGGIIFGRF